MRARLSILPESRRIVITGICGEHGRSPASHFCNYKEPRRNPWKASKIDSKLDIQKCGFLAKTNKENESKKALTIAYCFLKLRRANALSSSKCISNFPAARGEEMFHVMGRIFSLSTVVLLTLVETVENPAEPRNDAEVTCGH